MKRFTILAAVIFIALSAMSQQRRVDVNVTFDKKTKVLNLTLTNNEKCEVFLRSSPAWGKYTVKVHGKEGKYFDPIEWAYGKYGETNIILKPKEILKFSNSYYKDYIKKNDDKIEKLTVTCIIQNVPIRDDNYVTEELERYTKVFEFDWK